MSAYDLNAAAAKMAELIRNIADDQLTRPTPCPDYSLGDLVDHVGGSRDGVHVGRQQGVPAASARKVRRPMHRDSPTTGAAASPPISPSSQRRGSNPRPGPA